MTDNVEFFQEMEEMIINALRQEHYSVEEKIKLNKLFNLMKNTKFREFIARELINKDINEI